REVVGDAHVEREAFVLAVFADHPRALRPAAGGRCFALMQADSDLAVPYGGKAEDRPEELGPTCAGQPRDADDFAAMNGERCGDRFRLPGQTRDVEQFFALGARRARIEIRDIAADHHADNFRGGSAGGPAAADAAAVAQDDKRVADLAYFLQEMRDVDD